MSRKLGIAGYIQCNPSDELEQLKRERDELVTHERYLEMALHELGAAIDALIGNASEMEHKLHKIENFMVLSE